MNHLKLFEELYSPEAKEKIKISKVSQYKLSSVGLSIESEYFKFDKIIHLVRAGECRHCSNRREIASIKKSGENYSIWVRGVKGEGIFDDLDTAVDYIVDNV
jgi:hypothetical protein